MHVSLTTIILVATWVIFAIPVLWLCYDALHGLKELQKAQDNLTAACERFLEESERFIKETDG
jgi:hypothetical protein